MPDEPVRAAAPAHPPSAVTVSPDSSQFYGDCQFRDRLPETLRLQTEALKAQARAQPTNAEERSTLAISPEDAERLEKEGALVF